MKNEFCQLIIMINYTVIQESLKF